jgi:hypothetical protein
MELVPANVQLTFEVTYDASNLHVGMSVYDTTGVSPILVQGPTAMTHVVNNTYIGKFTPSVSHNYLIFKAVYTDVSLLTLDSNYSAGTESIVAEDISGGGGGSTAPTGCPVIGVVEPTPTIIGMIDSPSHLIGIVRC